MTETQPLKHQVVHLRSDIVDRSEFVRDDVHPLRPATKTLETDEMHCELLTFVRGDDADMKFSFASHLVIFLPDGMGGGCVWNNGGHMVKLSGMAPNTIIFSPALSSLSLAKKTSQASVRVLLLMIAPKSVSRLFGSDAEQITFEQKIGVDDEGLRRTLLNFLQEIENPDWNSELYVEASLTLLLCRLIRCVSSLGRPQRAIYKKGGLPGWRLKRVLELIERDLCEGHSLVELARRVELHPTTLCRAFKQSTGITPHRYLLLHRIKRAKDIMMQDQRRSLTDIGADCGFSSSSQFSLVFRRIAGLSPREYRRSL